MKDMVFTPETVEIPLDLIDIAIENPRLDKGVDQALIDELAQNIAMNGQLTPLIGYRIGERFQITAGGRRLRALRALVNDEDPSEVLTARIDVYPQEQAIHLGVAEQVAHEKLTRAEEVGFFALPAYRDMSDRELASMIGKSTAYVKQHRRVLELPVDAMNAFLADEITYEQALGLCYFIGHEDELADRLEHAKGNKWCTLDSLRADYARMFSFWSKHPATAYVTEEEYTKAGGVLSGDLFSEDRFIQDPMLLETLARPKILERIEEIAGRQRMVPLEADKAFWDIPVHPGIDETTDEERAWLAEHEYDHEDEANEDWTEEQVEAHLAKVAEIEAKFAVYPGDLARLLVTFYRVDFKRSEGFQFKCNCLPRTQVELEQLVVQGWMDPPKKRADLGETDETVEEISVSLRERIGRIKLHAVRQELAKDQNAILNAYEGHLSHGTRGDDICFSSMDAELPEPALLSTSAAFNKLRAAAEIDREARKPAEIKAALSYRMVCKVVSARDRVEALDAETVRTYWTPCEDFMKAYKKPDLIAMICSMDPERDAEGLESVKKGALVTEAVRLACERKDWLPIGF